MSEGAKELPVVCFSTLPEAHLLKHPEDALHNLVGNYVPPSTPRQPLALAMEWVAKITTVGLEMVLPGVGGVYLDKYFQTTFLALLGFGVGMTVGILHLLQMSRQPPDPPMAAEELQDKERQDSSGERSGK